MANNLHAQHEMAPNAKPSTSELQRGVFGLLLRRLSKSAGLTDQQNNLRDQIHENAAKSDFDQALLINHQLIQQIQTPTSSGTTGKFAGIISKWLGEKQHREQSPSMATQQRVKQLQALALDQAILLGMSGQPGDADHLIDQLLEANADAPDYSWSEDIFEAAIALAKLSGNTVRQHKVRHIRMRFLFEQAVLKADKAILQSALQAVDCYYRYLAGNTTSSCSVPALQAKAEMATHYAKTHEQTDILEKAGDMFFAAADQLRQNNSVQESYTLLALGLSVQIELARLLHDPALLAEKSKQISELLDLPDTMLTTEARADVKHLLGMCLTYQADMDGKLITLRKAFAHFEAAADIFAKLNLQAKQLRSLRDLALAKLTAAELIALQNEDGKSDLALAERYNTEARSLQQRISQCLQTANIHSAG